MLVLVALLVTLLGARPADAVERTFVFSPVDLAGAVEAFNAEVLAHSSTFGRQVGIRDGVRFFGRSCQALTPDGGRAVSRVRVLDGAGRAGLLVGRRPDFPLGWALQTMGAAAWTPPAAARTRQPSWVTEASAPGVVGFATAGFASGDPAGVIGFGALGDATPNYLVSVDLFSDVTSGPASLVLALTTELPPKRPGRMPKRSECVLVSASYPADVQALVDLVAATPLTDATRSRLNNILHDALAWVQESRPHRAARAAKRFALEVASRSAAEIPADAAEEMVTRGLLVSDALGF